MNVKNFPPAPTALASDMIENLNDHMIRLQSLGRTRSVVIVAAHIRMLRIWGHRWAVKCEDLKVRGKYQKITKACRDLLTLLNEEVGA